MKQFFTFCLLSIYSMSSYAQGDCTGGRYTNYNLFSAVDVTSDVVFGNNVALGGGNVDLKMDIYAPQGDAETNRAVIIMAFGGSFIGGAKEDVAFMCNILAKMGYVAVAPDYRVGFFLPNEVTTTAAVMRGMHDLNGCIRYLKKSANEDGNPYGIDCERIIAGGISAGAISAIHAGYFDKISEVPSYMANDTAGLGGVEGNSGTPNYVSDPLGVLSFSGAIGDTSWIEEGDPAIISIHEEDDNVVPYLTQEVAVSGIPTGLVASGSGHIHLRAANVGVENELKSYPGVQNHVGYLNPIDQTALDIATTFLADLVCSGETNSCTPTSSSTGVKGIENVTFSTYPNPAKDVLKFETHHTGTVEVVDAIGRTVFSTSTILGQNQLDVSNLPKGAYVLMLKGTTIGTARFIKE